jgi:hypothetical protein
VVGLLPICPCWQNISLKMTIHLYFFPLNRFIIFQICNSLMHSVKLNYVNYTFLARFLSNDLRYILSTR